MALGCAVSSGRRHCWANCRCLVVRPPPPPMQSEDMDEDCRGLIRPTAKYELCHHRKRFGIGYHDKTHYWQRMKWLARKILYRTLQCLVLPILLVLLLLSPVRHGWQFMHWISLADVIRARPRKRLQGLLDRSLVPRSLLDRSTGIWGGEVVPGWPNTPYTLREPVPRLKVCREQGCLNGWVAAAEAKKAEGASNTTLRIPNPPHLTGKFACIQCRSVRSPLEIIPKIFRCNSSNRASAEWEAFN